MAAQRVVPAHDIAQLFGQLGWRRRANPLVHGGNAAMVVHHILDTFFAKKDGKPLPPKPVIVPNLNPSMG